eukprot:TRINITY_DN23330_c0_g1_i1.p2 TRINITY_DN23330_c0_g1~~TRINITY_DN23330_c0_g1_i1.p2  ORF type:complete len:1183 (+),score=257.33 TRINITY_DN23330_c0_g1_i1:3381-6929(+)
MALAGALHRRPADRLRTAGSPSRSRGLSHRRLGHQCGGRCGRCGQREQWRRQSWRKRRAGQCREPLGRARGEIAASCAVEEDRTASSGAPPARLRVPGATSLDVALLGAESLPCGLCVAVASGEAEDCCTGILAAAPSDRIQVDGEACTVLGVRPRPPVWSLDVRTGVPESGLWDVENNIGKSHLVLDKDGRTVSYKKGAPDFCCVLGRAPIESGVHRFDFLAHKIGDELWIGLTDDPNVAGPRTNLRAHRNAYLYYCGRRRGAANNLRDGHASLQCGSKAEQRFEHVVDGDVVSVVLNAGRHRASFYRNGVLQGECMVPAKPLWLVVQLDAPGDKVEVRRLPVAPDALEHGAADAASAMVGRQTSAGEAALCAEVLLAAAAARDADDAFLSERFTVRGLFRRLEAPALPAGYQAFAGPFVRVLELPEAAGSLAIGVEICSGGLGAPARGCGGPYDAWTLGAADRNDGTQTSAADSPPDDDAQGYSADRAKAGPLQIGDSVGAVAVRSDEGTLVALTLLRNSSVAACWEFPSGQRPVLEDPRSLRLVARVRGADASGRGFRLRLEAPTAAGADVAGGERWVPDALPRAAWEQLLQLRLAALEPLAKALRVEAVPRALGCDGRRCLLETHYSEAWNRFRRLAFEEWSIEDDEALVRLAQRASDAAGGSLGAASASSARSVGTRGGGAAGRGSRGGDPALTFAQLRGALGESQRLGTHDAPSVHARYSLLRGFGSLVAADVLPFLDLRNLAAAPHGRLLLQCRRLLLPELRDAMLQASIERTATTVEEYLHLDRSAAMECRRRQRHGRDGADGREVVYDGMVFAQASRQAAQWPSKVFRSRNAPFRVRYRDEPGQDSGGVYRDFVDTVAEELMSPDLPIFIPVPNREAEVGEHRDAYLLNPALDVSPESQGRAWLHFLGRLMGVCLRRGDVLPLCLSQVVWKGLLGDALDESDLRSFDVAAAESSRQLRQLPQLGIDAQLFESYFSDLRFVAKDSAGEDRELIPRGASTRVSYEEASRLSELTLQMRLSEADQQLGHLRAGLATVVPLDALALWTWQYLEERVCGVAIVDVALLRKHVRYEGISPEAPEVHFLWQTLEELSQTDLRRFLHFVWGRSRLPRDGSPKWAEGFKVASQTSHGMDPDQSLPTAHTCFFKLDLPAYSSKDVCKRRIVFAIQNCMNLGIA